MEEKEEAKKKKERKKDTVTGDERKKARTREKRLYTQQGKNTRLFSFPDRWRVRKLVQTAVWQMGKCEFPFGVRLIAMPEVKQCWWLRGQRQGALFNYGPQSQTPNAFFGTFPPLSFCLMVCLCLLNCPKGQALSCCHLAESQLGGPDLWRIWFLASCCFIISLLIL